MSMKKKGKGGGFMATSRTTNPDGKDASMTIKGGSVNDGAVSQGTAPAGKAQGGKY